MSNGTLGATWDGRGTHFALFSAHATGVELCFFESVESAWEKQRFALERSHGGVWRTYVSGAGPGVLYGYRVHGPYEPQSGHRFNSSKLLVDPYAKAITGEPRPSRSLFSFDTPASPGSFQDRDSAASMPKCVVIDSSFDWRDDRHPRVPWGDTVIYECHVKGMTKLHPAIDKRLQGTYLGLAQPPVLEHLLALGVTAVELLPVHQIASEPHLWERELRNYWGYSSLGFFAPHAGYATGNQGEQVVEFKTMVRELHHAGLEVILDVVFNHTPEGDHLGPTLSLKGIDNRSYYRLEDRKPWRYVDMTGCQNTLDIRQPAALELVLASLRYWVEEMHVDGYRLDLATTLGRDSEYFEPSARFFSAIEEDPVLSRVKMIAEPWDLGSGGYQLGSFPRRWPEWNDRFRDAVRRFWRGDAGCAKELARRLRGSEDIMGRADKDLLGSINYVTSHDGFSLADLVSYEQKRNQANGEHDGDGNNDNLSCNWGHEGPTERRSVRTARRRAQRNMLATLIFSRGIPMLRHGDELGLSQMGNNNPYCQDSELTWLDWSSRQGEEDLMSFVRKAVAIRRSYPALRRSSFPGTEPAQLGNGLEASWLHPEGREVSGNDWSDPDCLTIGLYLPTSTGAQSEEPTLLLLLNARSSRITFRLPASGAGGWRTLLDTAADGEDQTCCRNQLEIESFSAVLLAADGNASTPGRV